MFPFTEPQLGRRRWSLFAVIVAGLSLLISLSSLNAQTHRKAATAGAGEEESGVFKDYRGVQLGMVADEVRKKLGDPKVKGDTEDFFIFNETETAQIVYEKLTHKVITISADFQKASSSVPTAKQVCGSEVEAKPDGSVYRMVRFPKAGYWVSYSRTSGDAPMVSVMLQKIQ